MHHRFIFLLLFLFPLVAYGHTVEVDVLFSDRHRPHVEVVKVLQKMVRSEDIRLFAGLENGDLSEEKKQLKTIQSRKPDVLVLVGEDALQAVLDMNIHIPAISIMSMRLNRDMQQRLDITGIDLRPAPSAIADELALLLPAHAKVLSYYDPEVSAAYIDEAADYFRKRHLQLIAKPWPEQDVQVALNSSMKRADAYWMQMEYRSVEPKTLQLLFLLAKRGKKLIGLSAKYVRAGALIAWSPQTRLIGRQAANLVNRVLSGEQASHIAVQHPQHMKLNIRTENDMTGGRSE